MTDILLTLIALGFGGAGCFALLFVTLAWSAAEKNFGPSLGKSLGILSIIVAAGYTFIVMAWLTEKACGLDPTFEQCAEQMGIE